MNDYNSCNKCGVKLREVKIKRTRPISCSNCRGNSQNHFFQQILKECAANSQKEEGRFEDISFDPEENIMMKNRPTAETGIKSSLGNL